MSSYKKGKFEDDFGYTDCEQDLGDRLLLDYAGRDPRSRFGVLCQRIVYRRSWSPRKLSEEAPSTLQPACNISVRIFTSRSWTHSIQDFRKIVIGDASSIEGILESCKMCFCFLVLPSKRSGDDGDFDI